MAWVALDRWDGELIFNKKPFLSGCKTWLPHEDVVVHLPKGSIKKLIGRDLTWEDEPVELKEN